MSIFSQWLDAEQTIIISHYDCDWEWEDLAYHNETMLLPMLESVNHPVAIISDMSQSDLLPEDDNGYLIGKLVELGHTYNHCDVDMVMFVHDEELLGSVISSIHRQFVNKGRKYYHTNTIDNAISVIREHRGLGASLSRY